MLKTVEERRDQRPVEFSLEDFLKEAPVMRRTGPGITDWMHTPEWEAVQDSG